METRFKEIILADGTVLKMEVETLKQSSKPQYILKIKTDTGRLSAPIQAWGKRFEFKNKDGSIMVFTDENKNAYKKFYPSTPDIERLNAFDNPFVIEGKGVQELNKWNNKVQDVFKISKIGREERKIPKF